MMREVEDPSNEQRLNYRNWQGLAEWQVRRGGGTVQGRERMSKNGCFTEIGTGHRRCQRRAVDRGQVLGSSLLGPCKT